MSPSVFLASERSSLRWKMGNRIGAVADFIRYGLWTVDAFIWKVHVNYLSAYGPYLMPAVLVTVGSVFYYRRRSWRRSVCYGLIATFCIMSISLGFQNFEVLRPKSLPYWDQVQAKAHFGSCLTR